MGVTTDLCVKIRNRTPEQLASAVSLACGSLTDVNKTDDGSYVLEGTYYLGPFFDYNEESREIMISMHRKCSYPVMKKTECITRIIRAAMYLGDADISWGTEYDKPIPEDEEHIHIPPAPEDRPAPDKAQFLTMLIESRIRELVGDYASSIHGCIREKKPHPQYGKGYSFLEEYMEDLYSSLSPEQYWDHFGIRMAIELFCVVFNVKELDDIQKIEKVQFSNYAVRKSDWETLAAAFGIGRRTPQDLLRFGLARFFRHVGRDDLAELCERGDAEDAEDEMNAKMADEIKDYVKRMNNCMRD